MRIARLFAGASLSLAAACGSITDPGVRPEEEEEGGLARRAGALPASMALAPARTPVLFVHGWNSSGSTWNTMVSRFKADGYTSADLHVFSYNSAQSNATTAGIIRGKVDSILAATGALRVSIVTHSMGALSARYYVRNLGGDWKVDALVSLGGPNHGTTTAYFCLQLACLQMHPNSSFLTALNASDETWGMPRYATWWTPCDLVINPRSSTALSGAVNTQTACLAHGQLQTDATVYAQVRDWVRGPTAAALVASLSFGSTFGLGTDGAP